MSKIKKTIRAHAMKNNKETV